MAVNIEIKARLRNPEAVLRAAEGLSDTACEVIRQEDIFFNAPRGRLKLRILAQDAAQLIYYVRPDARGPKASMYEISPSADPQGLKRALEAALGVRGEVRKTRRLYLAGRTRIHIDHVEGLGDFMELEVVMVPGQPEEEGVRIANELMSRLGVSAEDLVEGAYIDLLDQSSRGGAPA